MDLAYELHDLVRTLDREAERILMPERLSYNQYVALVILGEHPGITGRILARALGVTEPAASGIVRALLGRGLVADQAPSGSGNRRYLHLTPAGTAMVERCGALLGSRLDDTARAIGVDPTELARTVRILHEAVRD